MMIHFEQQNIEVAKYVASSIIRTMKKKNMQNICEYAFCAFFADMKSMPSSNDWQLLKKKWKTIENNTTTPPFVTEFMELEKWIISKAENKSYQEVLQQKLRKK
jgi:hypothetical protein